MSTLTGTAERQFTPADHDHVTVDGTRAGLLVTGPAFARPDARPAGRTTTGAPMWWLPVAEQSPGTGCRTAAAAYDLVSEDAGGISTVTLAPARITAARLGLATAFAAHLAHGRAWQTPRRCITSPSPAEPPPGTVRIPHLVAVRPYGNAVADTVVWELMAAADTHAWLEEPLPDQIHIEAHLPELLRLRSLARRDHLPQTPAGRELAGLLRQRYLSIRLAYQRPDLFTDLFTDLTQEPT